MENGESEWLSKVKIDGRIVIVLIKRFRHHHDAARSPRQEERQWLVDRGIAPHPFNRTSFRPPITSCRLKFTFPFGAVLDIPTICLYIAQQIHSIARLGNTRHTRIRSLEHTLDERAYEIAANVNAQEK